MEAKKIIEQSTTEEGCNVRTVTHEDGAQDITLDTVRVSVLLALVEDMHREGFDPYALATYTPPRRP